MANIELVKGRTSTGFDFSVKKNLLENIEFLELYAKVQDGDSMKMFQLLDMVLGEAQKKDLYDHVRNDDGDVLIDPLTKELTDIFDRLGEVDATKN